MWFTLCKQDILFIIKAQDKRCVYCATDLDFQATIKARRRGPSLDKIVPSLGYTRHNVVISCFRCNTIKHDATPDELRKIAKRIDELTIERSIWQEH